MARSEEDFQKSYEVNPRGCWVWQAGTTTGGVPRFGSVWASRYAWNKVNPPVPLGRRLVKTCGERRCVNPAHAKVVNSEPLEAAQRFKTKRKETADA